MYCFCIYKIDAYSLRIYACCGTPLLRKKAMEDRGPVTELKFRTYALSRSLAMWAINPSHKSFASHHKCTSHGSAALCDHWAYHHIPAATKLKSEIIAWSIVNSKWSSNPLERLVHLRHSPRVNNDYISGQYLNLSELNFLVLRVNSMHKIHSPILILTLFIY